MPETLDQQRAEYAWAQVSQAAEQRILGDYTSLAKGLPALIMRSGLMQTLAFLQAKGSPHHLALLNQLCRWLGKSLGNTPLAEQGTFPAADAARFDSVMTALHAAPTPLYLRATEETLALLRWIRQFADARKSMEG